MKKLLTAVFLLTLVQTSSAFAALSCFAAVTRIFSHESMSSETAKKLGSYQKFIAQLLKTNPRDENPAFQEGWSCDGGSCMTSSSLVIYKLKSAGYPVEKLVAQTPSGAREHHSYIIDRTNPAEEIIIDPTYQQLFRKGALTKESPIFVGTRAQLIQLFRKYQKDMIPRGLEEINMQIDPQDYVEWFYGFGRYELDSHGQPTRDFQN